MNNKGEQNQMGIIIGVFMAILVGTILLTASAQQVGQTQDIPSVANASVTTSANGTTIANLQTLEGKRVTDVVVYNTTGDVPINAGNFTIYNNQVIDGTETAGVNVSAETPWSLYDWQFSYDFQPTTYISNGGARAVAGLIIIFFALAIAVVTLFPAMKSKIFG